MREAGSGGPCSWGREPRGRRNGGCYVPGPAQVGAEGELTHFWLWLWLLHRLACTYMLGFNSSKPGWETSAFISLYAMVMGPPSFLSQHVFPEANKQQVPPINMIVIFPISVCASKSVKSKVGAEFHMHVAQFLRCFELRTVV